MTEDVLIVSKTHMSSGICVGGLILRDNRYVRLLDRGNKNQPNDTDFEIGTVWSINFINRASLTPPHIEDIIILNKNFVKNIDDISSFLLGISLIDWEGHIDTLFGGKIKWTQKGSGFIDETNLPSQSVGFWKTDKELIKNESYGKIRYDYPNGDNLRSLKFVGLIPAIEIIPSGTLLRISLARWWNNDGDTENRCYLQLSGWYL